MPPPAHCTLPVQAFQQQQQRHHQHLITSSPEPSAALGILSERFICGPELTPTQQHDPYYCSELGQVYFPPNAWPSTLAAAPELQQLQQLQPQMLACYSQCEAIAAALMRLFAAALGVDQHFFDDKLVGHHSNMQVGAAQARLCRLPFCGCTAGQPSRPCQQVALHCAKQGIL